MFLLNSSESQHCNLGILKLAWVRTCWLCTVWGKCCCFRTLLELKRPTWKRKDSSAAQERQFWGSWHGRRTHGLGPKKNAILTIFLITNRLKLLLSSLNGMSFQFCLLKDATHLYQEQWISLFAEMVIEPKERALQPNTVPLSYIPIFLWQGWFFCYDNSKAI